MKLLRVNYLIGASSKVYVAHFKGPSWLPGCVVTSEIEEEVEVNEECYFDDNGQLRMHYVSPPYQPLEFQEKLELCGDLKVAMQMRGIPY